MSIDISVIMPCYNDGAYLREAAGSLKLAENENIELIIIDDESDDSRTLSVLAELEREGVQVLHTNHVGPSGARNEGIARAKGRYILPLDADDRIEAEYPRVAMALLEKDPEIGVVYCHADLFGEKTGPWEVPDYSFERMLVENLVFVTALFRREDWVLSGGFRTDMKAGIEDYDFFIGILARGKKIVQLPEVYFHYRIKKTSRTTMFLSDPEKVKEAYRRIYEHHEAFYLQNAKIYSEALRNEWIRERYEKEKIQQLTGWISGLKKFAPVRRLARKLLGR